MHNQSMDQIDQSPPPNAYHMDNMSQGSIPYVADPRKIVNNSVYSSYNSEIVAPKGNLGLRSQSVQRSANVPKHGGLTPNLK